MCSVVLPYVREDIFFVFLVLTDFMKQSYIQLHSFCCKRQCFFSWLRSSSYFLCGIIHVHGLLSWFRILAIVDWAVTNVTAQIIFSHADFTSSWYIPRSGMDEWYGRSIFRSLRNVIVVLVHIFINRGWVQLSPPQRCQCLLLLGLQMVFIQADDEMKSYCDFYLHFSHAGKRESLTTRQWGRTLLFFKGVDKNCKL